MLRLTKGDHITMLLVCIASQKNALYHAQLETYPKFSEINRLFKIIRQNEKELAGLL
jgi:hypothetical protein